MGRSYDPISAGYRSVDFFSLNDLPSTRHTHRKAPLPPRWVVVKSPLIIVGSPAEAPLPKAWRLQACRAERRPSFIRHTGRARMELEELQQRANAAATPRLPPSSARTTTTGAISPPAQKNASPLTVSMTGTERGFDPLAAGVDTVALYLTAGQLQVFDAAPAPGRNLGPPENGAALSGRTQLRDHRGDGRHPPVAGRRGKAEAGAAHRRCEGDPQAV